MLKSIADDWVLITVEATAREHRTAGGLVIPHAMENVSFATVVMIGGPKPYPGTDGADCWPMAPATAGDRVLIQSIRGIPEHIVTLDGVQYRMIRHHDILGVINPQGPPVAEYGEETFVDAIEHIPTGGKGPGRMTSREAQALQPDPPRKEPK